MKISSKTYPIRVTTTNIGKLIDAGHYNVVAPVSDDDFVVGKKGKVRIQLLHFDQTEESEDGYVEFEDVLDLFDQLAKVGVRPATAAELLTLDAQYPELKRQFTIVAMDAECQSLATCVLCIHTRLDKSRLELHPICRTTKNDRFAIVSKR